jgi:hypothetical protein
MSVVMVMAETVRCSFQVADDKKWWFETVHAEYERAMLKVLVSNTVLSHSSLVYGMFEIAVVWMYFLTERAHRTTYALPL